VRERREERRENHREKWRDRDRDVVRTKGCRTEAGRELVCTCRIAVSSWQGVPADLCAGLLRRPERGRVCLEPHSKGGAAAVRIKLTLLLS
jgi:hypothetical protein